ncbi:MAG: hypothetical protein ACFFE8_10295 [Candidatus Heimdallarchaeota archaeon]
MFTKSDSQGVQGGEWLLNRHLASQTARSESTRIKALIGIIEHGGLLFHLTFPDIDPPPSAILQANLVSALVSFTTQVKEDTLESIRMSREQMFFRRQEGIIFILVVDSKVKYNWVAKPLADIHETFCRQFPSVLLTCGESLVFDVTQFDPFKIQAAARFNLLDAHLNLLLLLLDETLIKEEEVQDLDPLEWTSIVSGRLLKQNSLYGRSWKTIHRLQLVELLLERIESYHISRVDREFTLNCAECRLCENQFDCFYLEILETLLSHLHIEYEVHWDEVSQIRTVSIPNTSGDDIQAF